MSNEKKRATVIGAGIFGCSMAITLSYLGYQVVLVERLPKILYGATRNNTNRVHLGFHYPRDPNTARMCKENFKYFVNFCPEAIVRDFPNAYCIASENSKTLAADYLAFCEALELPYENVDFDTYPTQILKCDVGLVSEEVVVDIDILRNMLFKVLHNRENIQILCETEVNSIKKNGSEYELTCQNQNIWHSDVVVNCSYANSNHLTQQLGYDIVKQQFEYTIVPIVELDLPTQGITVMDGPFFGLLPYGHQGQYTLYHVDHSVISTEVNELLDPNWLLPATSPSAEIDRLALFEKFKAACAEFVPALAQAKICDFLEGPRMVLANHDNDDARPSILHNYGDGYFTVFSGKLDHFFAMSEAICDALDVSRLERNILHGGVLLKNWHNSWKNRA